jgi:hypothetical protein
LTKQQLNVILTNFISISTKNCEPLVELKIFLWLAIYASTYVEMSWFGTPNWTMRSPRSEIFAPGSTPAAQLMSSFLLLRTSLVRSAASLATAHTA